MDRVTNQASIDDDELAPRTSRSSNLTTPATSTPVSRRSTPVASTSVGDSATTSGKGAERPVTSPFVYTI